jgi:midasin
LKNIISQPLLGCFVLPCTHLSPQLPKAILLEGSPGVGKTSLVLALAAASGHSVVRINLRYELYVFNMISVESSIFCWKINPILFR